MEITVQNESKPFKITVIRDDDIEAFGAYAAESIKDEDGGIILLNIDGTVGVCSEDSGNIKEYSKFQKEAIIETLMHEFGHALEEWYDLEFDESRIEKIVDGYRKKYG